MLDREINVCEARKCPLNSVRSFQFNASHSPFKRFHHGLREDGERANHLLMRCALKMVSDREESLERKGMMTAEQHAKKQSQNI